MSGGESRSSQVAGARQSIQSSPDSALEGDRLELPVLSLRSAIHPIKRLVNHGLVPGAVPCLDIGLDLLEEVSAHAVWLYFRFPLGLRMVEELLAARGIS